ncbi:MAG: hypothetical protein FWG00_02690 [Coriobacteriia bacterium]|nr:hypothetical protein [Coriobacteriia bacterium]
MKKIVTIVTIAAMLATLLTGCDLLSSNTPEPSPPPAEISDPQTPQAPSVDEYAEEDEDDNAAQIAKDTAAYEPVLEAYKTWALAEYTYELPEPWCYLYDRETLPENCFYALKDLNNNGSLELILLSDLYYDGMGDYILISLYSLVDGQPTELYYRAMKSGWSLVDQNGIVYGNFSDGVWLRSWVKREISSDGSKLIDIESIMWEKNFDTESVDCFLKDSDGNKIEITEAEYERLAEQYNSTVSNKDAELDIIPLFN